MDDSRMHHGSSTNAFSDVHRTGVFDAGRDAN